MSLAVLCDMHSSLTLSLVIVCFAACGDGRNVPGVPDGGAVPLPDSESVLPDGSTGGSPDAGSCPASVIEGDTCATEGLTCVNLGSTCGPGWGGYGLARCDCTGGSWVCSSVGDAECASGLVPDGTSCSMEGTGTCDDPPAGGGCSCKGGTWSCSSSCPDWCPGYAPDGGGEVTCPASAEGDVCRYNWGGETCTCTGGKLDCSTW
jgi:hypothetical protein